MRGAKCPGILELRKVIFRGSLGLVGLAFRKTCSNFAWSVTGRDKEGLPEEEGIQVPGKTSAKTAE